MNDPVNIITLKWGTLYGPEYVNRLYNGVKRNLSRPFRFICFTENPEGVTDEVECLEFPEFPVNPSYEWSAWRKFSILRDDVPFDGLSLFLDLDVIITGSMDCFFEFGSHEQFPIIHNWIEPHKTWFRPRPDIGNSSCFRFVAKTMSFAYDQFIEAGDDAVLGFPTEQAYLTHCMREHKVFWPEEWVQSFKRHCQRAFPLNWLLEPKLPKDARIIAFHGRPNPNQAVEGFRGRKLHHYTRPTPWILEYWK